MFLLTTNYKLTANDENMTAKKTTLSLHSNLLCTALCHKLIKYKHLKWIHWNWPSVCETICETDMNEDQNHLSSEASMLFLLNITLIIYTSHFYLLAQHLVLVFLFPRNGLYKLSGHIYCNTKYSWCKVLHQRGLHQKNNTGIVYLNTMWYVSQTSELQTTENNVHFLKQLHKRKIS